MSGESLLLAVLHQTRCAGHGQLHQVHLLLRLRLLHLLPAVAPHAGPGVPRLAALQLVNISQQLRRFINDFLRLRPGRPQHCSRAARSFREQQLSIWVWRRLLRGASIVLRGETGLTEAHHVGSSYGVIAPLNLQHVTC